MPLSLGTHSIPLCINVLRQDKGMVATIIVYIIIGRVICPQHVQFSAKANFSHESFLVFLATAAFLEHASSDHQILYGVHACAGARKCGR